MSDGMTGALTGELTQREVQAAIGWLILKFAVARHARDRRLLAAGYHASV
jgi:hypothetical protein